MISDLVIDPLWYSNDIIKRRKSKDQHFRLVILSIIVKNIKI